MIWTSYMRPSNTVHAHSLLWSWYVHTCKVRLLMHGRNCDWMSWCHHWLIYQWELITNNSQDSTITFVTTECLGLVSVTSLKKALRDAQTLRTAFSKAEPNFFAPPQTPFLGARDGQNLISWRWSLPLPTNPVWWGSITQFQVIVVTDPQTHPHTNRHGRLQYTAPQLSAQCNNLQCLTDN